MSRRATQRERLLELLRSRAPEWVALPEVLALGIAQYNARVYELRKAGWKIENRTEQVNGVVHSWFRLIAPAGLLLADLRDRQ